MPSPNRPTRSCSRSPSPSSRNPLDAYRTTTAARAATYDPIGRCADRVRVVLARARIVAAMAIEIREVRVGDYLDQVGAGRPELGGDRVDLPLDLSRAHYEALDAAGVLFALAALDDGALVGYCTAVVSPHPFNPAVVCCASDALFVHPDYRSGSTGARLILEAERAQRNRARRHAHALAHRSGTPLAAMLTRRGYEPADITVMKRLNHGN